MPKIVLFPCGSSVARGNYFKTAVSKISVNYLYENSESEELRNFLNSKYKVNSNELISVWGSRDRYVKNINNNGFNTGKSYFCGDGMVFSEAEVIFHAPDKKLGQLLWRGDPENGWGYIFIIENLRPFNVSQMEFTRIISENNISSYVRGFRIQEISDDQSLVINAANERSFASMHDRNVFNTDINIRVSSNNDFGVTRHGYKTDFFQEDDGKIIDIMPSDFIEDNEDGLTILGVGKEIRVKSEGIELAPIKDTIDSNNVRIVLDNFVKESIDSTIYYTAIYDDENDLVNVHGHKKARRNCRAGFNVPGNFRRILIHIVQSSKSLRSLINIRPDLERGVVKSELEYPAHADAFPRLHDYPVGQPNRPRRFAIMVHGLGSNCLESLSKLDVGRVRIPIFRFEHNSVGVAPPDNSKELVDLVNGIVNGEGDFEVIFLAHSRGGLVAKLAANSIQNLGSRVRVLTYGTPHYGAELASIACKFLAIAGSYLLGNIGVAILNAMGFFKLPGVAAICANSGQTTAINLAAMHIRCTRYGGNTYMGSKEEYLRIVRYLIANDNDGIVPLISSLEANDFNDGRIVNCNHFDYFYDARIRNEIYNL